MSDHAHQHISGAFASNPPPVYSGQFAPSPTTSAGALPDEKSIYNQNLYSKDGLVNILLPRVANWIAGILAALAVAFLMVAGFQFIFAGGEQEQIKKAAETAFYVLGGVLLAMFAYAIIYLFLTLLSPS